MNKFLFIIAACIFVECSTDSYEVKRVVDGNSVELSNGVIISLMGVGNAQSNRQLLETYIGQEVFLFDSINDPVENPLDQSYLYLYNRDGENINQLLQPVVGLNHEEELKPIPAEQAPSPKNLSTLYKELSPAVILIYAATDTSASQGSGFIVHPNGIAISNYHVFEGTLKGKEQIKTQNGEIYSISEVIHKSKEGDFIIFKLSNPNDQIFPFLSVSYELPQVGEECFAIGNPQGLENTLSRGIISQIRGNGNLIQTTTEITHGSSGGPLFNMDGKVIGITTAGYEQANLNFAVSILLLREHLNFN